MIANSEEVTAIEVTDGISRATLDTIGDVGFKCRFGALDNERNPLAQAYKNLLVSTFGLRLRVEYSHNMFWDIYLLVCFTFLKNFHPEVSKA